MNKWVFERMFFVLAVVYCVIGAFIYFTHS